ncbi:HB21 protein, partial [Catharus fuscescens]|nr:HB21 protein [Catharus fuscescens]
PSDLCIAHTEVFQRIFKGECHFINGTEKVRYVTRDIYNREELLRFDSDVGRYEGLTPYGEKWAHYLNSKQAELDYRRAEVDRYCRYNYELFAPFSVER